MTTTNLAATPDHPQPNAEESLRATRERLASLGLKDVDHVVVPQPEDDDARYRQQPVSVVERGGSG